MARSTVSGVSSYDVDGDTVHLDCELDAADADVTQPWPLPVTLTFYDPSTFHFELEVNPETATEPDYPEYDPEAVAEPVALEVTETDGQLHLETDRLRVVVGLDTWSFRVESLDGTIVFEEQRADFDVAAQHRVDPLGFTQERINNRGRRVDETGTAFRLSPDEKIYGVGEQFVEFDRRGREIEAWHEEPLGTETERAYKSIPFHLSTNGYGMLVDTTNRVSYDFGKTSTASATVGVDDDRFAFVFFYGPEFRDVVETYTAFTGRPDRPPKWSFGTWMSRLGYESRAELESITDRLREESIPCDVVHLDPFWMPPQESCTLEWDTDQFPDPEGMIDGLNEKGFRLSLWEHPHVPAGTEAFEEGVEEEYFVTDGTGDAYLLDNTCQGNYRGALVDFTNPAAVEWWKDKHRRLLEMGVSVFKTDYGEYVPTDAVFHNGKSGTSMHNLYPYLYNEAVYETVGEVNGDDEAIVWGRAAWTGSQRFPMHWGGDPQTTWNGMSAALRGGLSASLSGIAFWSHDIGGFRGRPSDELYVRWAQFGLLSSNSRCHGTTPREPWEYGEEALDVFRAYARLRYRLLPYLYTYAEVAARTGLPVVRPLVLEYQDDPATHRLDTQYLLGEDVLVAPVYEGATTRDVYLPEGEWYYHETGRRYTGKTTVSVDAPLDTMPIFYRGGGVVPRRAATETVQPGTPAELTYRVFLADGVASGRYYDEETDAMLDVEVDATGDEVEVSLDEGSVTAIILDVSGVDDRPDEVCVNGTAPETWEYDSAANDLEIVV
ncbi:glycoside hydrolase family 31 protein [Halorarius litoreus]|uniref:glycoside hydrolase family 31 protein n=1 Tax=Halorarius litoreus TaxID=2962676 RepID=UPI0020CB9471|nr:glycoside hydrolase family 31 protein [Halorarius litoreus]